MFRSLAMAKTCQKYLRNSTASSYGNQLLASTGGQYNKRINVSTVRYKVSTPINTVMLFVPQQEAWIVERMGKFHRILEPGLNILVPVIDRVKYVQSLKEIAIDVPKQSAITLDNVTLSIDGVLYLRILDAYLASYGVEDPEFAITQLAQTTMRSELGKMSLDKVFRERESLNVSIVDSINKASLAWGITCLRYEIRDIKLPNRVHEAMQMQVEAERRKRAAILESEGIREADINVAEGKRQSRILASEAQRMEQINHANGEAAAMVAVAEARARGLNIVAQSLKEHEGKNAASLFIAEEYVHAFNKLARTNNTLILPANAGDVTSLVAQAMSIYGAVSKHNTQTTNPPSGSGGGNDNSDNRRGGGDNYDETQLHKIGTGMEEIFKNSQINQQLKSGELLKTNNKSGDKENESTRRKDETLLINEQLNIKLDKENKRTG